MNQVTKNQLASCVLSVLLFCHRIHAHAQFQPPYDISAHAQYATTTFGWVLKRHVIRTLSNMSGIGQCFIQCSFTDCCYSLNFYPYVSVCELNHATNASHPRDKRRQTGGKMFLDARVHPGHLVPNLFISSLVKIWKITSVLVSGKPLLSR